MLVVLPCFDLCRSNSFHVYIQRNVAIIISELNFESYKQTKLALMMECNLKLACPVVLFANVSKRPLILSSIIFHFQDLALSHARRQNATQQKTHT